MSFDRATQRQHRAADPGQSTWVSANAGSGKTRVLTNRVARLLLHGTSPESILCLTYTKAAAAEMQNRLFALLGSWSMKGDAELREDLAELGEVPGALGADTLAKARRLFAAALETPGGLKIQTIHAFCASILRRFPLEAGVNPNFRELDDRQRAQLFEEVLEGIATDTPATFLAAAQAVGEDTLASLPTTILKEAQTFAVPFDAQAVQTALGFDALRDDAGLRAAFDRAVPPEDIARFVKVLPLANKTYQKTVAAPTPEQISEDTAFLDWARSAFLSQKLEPRSVGGALTKDLSRAMPDADAVFEAAVEATWAITQERSARQTLETTRALHDFAHAFVTAFERRKARLGLLDFDDQIQKTRALLSDGAASAWVLYKLDGGIDHILVDEAQDTSPAQWDVINALTDAFHGGLGAAEDRARTIFVVGDAKQSIYSFQGADLRSFQTNQKTLKARLKEAQTGLNTVELQHSFRSAAAILNVVDKVCGHPEWRGGAQDVTHLAFRTNRPGRVDLWPLVPRPDKPADGDWSKPLDLPAPDEAHAVLARAIAREVRRWLDGGEALVTEDGPRPVRPEDILILVRSRSAAFTAIIRELKARGVPVAGADRLKLMDEIGVRDLIALARFAVTPVDDLSLATALRSPLFGLTEADLFDLAHGRGRQTLIARLQADPRFAGPADRLNALRREADFLRPFEFFHRVLVEEDGRRAL
ncbi:MAG: UvrD-helicase domain-containing protein, partial [Pseudomonadota bacterium]